MGISFSFVPIGELSSISDQPFCHPFGYFASMLVLVSSQPSTKFLVTGYLWLCQFLRSWTTDKSRWCMAAYHRVSNLDQRSLVLDYGGEGILICLHCWWARSPTSDFHIGFLPMWRSGMHARHHLQLLRWSPCRQLLNSRASVRESVGHSQ